MNCEITVGWHNGTDDMKLNRTREPEEIWGPTPSPRNVIQAIGVLDDTYIDTRAALLATMPESAQAQVPVVQFLSAEEARLNIGRER